MTTTQTATHKKERNSGTCCTYLVEVGAFREQEMFQKAERLCCASAVGLRQEGWGQLLLWVAGSPAEALASGVSMTPEEWLGRLGSAEGVEVAAGGCLGSSSLKCCRVEPLVTGTQRKGSAHWLREGKRALGCEPPSSQGSCQGEEGEQNQESPK